LLKGEKFVAAAIIFLAAINAAAGGIRYYEADGRSADRSDN
jgi:hypothetical protein